MIKRRLIYLYRLKNSNEKLAPHTFDNLGWGAFKIFHPHPTQNPVADEFANMFIDAGEHTSLPFPSPLPYILCTIPVPEHLQLIGFSAIIAIYYFRRPVEQYQASQFNFHRILSDSFQLIIIS